jgi:glutamate-ammonia-ligase adenylyltransferase
VPGGAGRAAAPRGAGAPGPAAHPLRARAARGQQLPRAPPDAPVAAAPAADWDAIRTAKYRGLLRIGARDLAGRPFEASLGELSDLADRCLVAALAAASDDCGAAAPALLALGKLGGRELNFSSDVDLIFVYHPSADEDPLVQNQATAQLIRRLKQQLELPTAEGFGYRVDLDLRPEGRSGVLANSVEAALSYYESFGAEWERQALLRLRAVAGAPQAAADFERGIVPFVYRRLIDPETMQRVHEMKARIEEERRRAGKDIDADLKEGPGGIRDVEFLTQALQLLYGGREPEVRGGNVLAALRALERLRLLPEATCEALRAAYLWLRRAEHALQLAEEQQTARFPRDGVAQTALARRMGYADELASDAQARMLDEWTAVRGSVRAHFEALVLRAEA